VPLSRFVESPYQILFGFCVTHFTLIDKWEMAREGAAEPRGMGASGASARKVGVMNQEDNRHCMGRGRLERHPSFLSVPPQALATFSPGRTSVGAFSQQPTPSSRLTERGSSLSVIASPDSSVLFRPHSDRN